MSFGIYWEPVKPVQGTSLPNGLKFVLRERYFGGNFVRGTDAYFTSKDIGYLHGLEDAGHEEAAEGARELIRAINQHGTVRVWIGNADD
jgi:hypothetical protein